jgi:hypothetical protein
VAVTYTAQAATDGLLYSNKVATEMVLGALEDRTSLLGHSEIVMAEDLMGPNWHVGLTPGGTITFVIDMALPTMSSTAETTDMVAATTLDFTNTTMSTGAYDVCFGVSNELRRRDQHGLYQVVSIASRILRSAVVTVTRLLVALAPSATTTVGTTGTPLTWDVIRSGAQAIKRVGLSEAAGRVVVILHPAQWESVVDDLGSASGARAERRELDSAQMIGMVGFQGIWDDIEVWTSAAVTESGGDYSGLMFVRGGIGMAIVPPAEPAPGQDVVLQTPLVQVTAAYSFADKSTQLGGDMTVGVAILRQDLVREVLST